MSKPTYKRGQVEWAIWRRMLFGRAPSAMPQLLAIRLRKLLEIDRRGELMASASPQAPYAFLETPPGGTGTDLQLTWFDACCLAMGLDMLNFGFAQSEVVFLFRHLREELRPILVKAAEQPSMGQRHKAEGSLGAPRRVDDERLADFSVYMVVPWIETADLIEREEALIGQPVFCFGARDLARKLQDLGLRLRQAYVAEIGETARFLKHELPKAPAIRRGRS